jgi:hypothetical protein
MPFWYKLSLTPSHFQPGLEYAEDLQTLQGAKDMKKFLPVFSMIIFVLTAVAASALTFPIPQVPDFPESEWVPGTALSYSVNFSQGDEDTNLNLKVAILGTETQGSTRLYWVEFDLTNIVGLPSDIQAFFIDSYGEVPSSIRMKALVPYYNLITMYTDPTRFYYDWTASDFIRTLIFQYNRQVPQDIQPSLIGGFIVPFMVSQFIGGENLPEDFIDGRNIGIQTVEDPQLYTTELSESETTTDAGSFDGWLYSFIDTTAGTDSGTCFYTDSTPIVPFVSYQGTWVMDSEPGSLDVQLVGIVEGDAQSEIVGEPQLVNLNTLMQ